MIELVAAISGHVQIFVAVVVVVAYRNTHSVTRSLKPRFFGHILKSSVFPLMVEAIPILRPGFLRDGARRSGIAERSPVDDEDVQATIVVVIKKRHSRAHGFNQIFFGSVRSQGTKIQSKSGSGFGKPGHHRLTLVR